MSPDLAQLLEATLRRDWVELSAATSMSPTRLTQLALAAVDDPEVIAAHPIQTRLLRERRDAGRAARTARR